MKDTLYLSDLDGTLLRGDATLSPRSAQMLSRLIRRGVRFSFATARSPESSLPILSGVPLELPVVAYNGAVLCDPRNRGILHTASLRFEDYREEFTALVRRGYSPLVHAMIGGHARVSRIRGSETPAVQRYLDARIGDPRMRLVEGIGALYEGELINISLMGDEPDMRAAHTLLAHCGELMLHLQKDTYPPYDYWLEIQHGEGNKAAGALWLKRRLGLKRLVCFGDNLNDLPMFRVADQCYAVQGAPEELRAAATGIIPSGDQDGVARFLWDLHGGE